MRWIVDFSVKAAAQLEYWNRSGQKKLLDKIHALVKELEEHPTTGTGHPEQLKGDKHGCWSRRINKCSRMVYSIDAGIVTVTVMSLRGHYDDK